MPTLLQDFDDLEALLRGMQARLRDRERQLAQLARAAPPVLCQVQSCPLF
jgi:hypothetical protein